MAGGAGAVGLAQGVTAGDQRDDFLVVHGHVAEGGADGRRSRGRVAAGVGAFGVDVDQAHLGGSQRVLGQRLGVTVAEPGLLVAPVHIQVGFPHIIAASGEAKGAKAAVLQRHVASQDHQVGPGNLLPVLLLDGPEQAARLVQADVVGPAVERSETLLPPARAAAPIHRAISAGAVPGHADEQAGIGPPVSGPPVLRIGQQGLQVALQRRIVELLELGAVVECRAQGVGAFRVLVQQVDAQLLGPPIAGGGACTGGVEGALGLGRGLLGHGSLLCGC